jgi:hypothetical protein
MPSVFNYAEQWAQQILTAIMQGTLCSPYITNNVRWLNAKTFHFTQMSTTGYKNHARTGGWNRGEVTQADVPFTLYHDRDIEFMIDKADVDETNSTATIQNISQQFIQLQANPEIDAEFFSKVTDVAVDNDLYSNTPASSWDTTNVFPRLKAMMKTGKLRLYKQRGSLLCYVTSDIMDLLERSKDFTRKIEMTQISNGGLGIETRVTEIDGVTLFEVIDVERFYSEFNFASSDGGFVPAVGAKKINVLMASTEMVKKVPKINSIYFFAPGSHTQGDGYLYQNRAFSGTFVFPNGKDNAIDSIFVDLDFGDELVVTSEEGATSGKSIITVLDTPYTGNVYKYKAGAGTVALPAYGATLGAGWLALTSGNEYTLTTGQDLGVVEVTPQGTVVRTGHVTIASKA